MCEGKRFIFIQDIRGLMFLWLWHTKPMIVQQKLYGGKNIHIMVAMIQKTERGEDAELRHAFQVKVPNNLNSS